jgi:hypothetical protein
LLAHATLFVAHVLLTTLVLGASRMMFALVPLAFGGTTAHRLVRALMPQQEVVKCVVVVEFARLWMGPALAMRATV